MARFIVLMLENDNAWDKLPEAEQKSLFEKYVAYTKGLRDAGRFVDGAPIGGGGVELTPAPDGAFEGEYTQAKRNPTGYFVIEADDLDAATAVARDCPALLHGETVVVRPLGH